MPTIHDLDLDAREFTTIAMPFNLYCSRTTCQTVIRKGEPAKRYDGATYTHANCPSTPHRTFAPHKYGDAK